MVASHLGGGVVVVSHLGGGCGGSSLDILADSSLDILADFVTGESRHCEGAICGCDGESPPRGRAGCDDSPRWPTLLLSSATASLLISAS